MPAMSMLAYNEIRERKYIVMDGAPYEVLSSHVFRKQQRKPVNAAKLRHLLTGKVVEHSFAVSDKVDEAEITETPLTYLYNHRGEYWFSDAKDKSKRRQLPASLVEEKIKFVKPNTEVKLLTFNNQPLGLNIPIKVDLLVKEAPPSIRGNTVTGGNKKVVLETGAEVLTPMFVNTGDVIRINTDTGEYLERV
jgi:elongation factor P